MGQVPHRWATETRVAADGTVTLDDDERGVLWILDLGNGNWPEAAHQVVETDGQSAVAVCGMKVGKYHSGWMETRLDVLPMADWAIHCRR